MTKDEAIALAAEVKSGKCRSYVQAARDLAEYISGEPKRFGSPRMPNEVERPPPDGLDCPHDAADVIPFHWHAGKRIDEALMLSWCDRCGAIKSPSSNEWTYPTEWYRTNGVQKPSPRNIDYACPKCGAEPMKSCVEDGEEMGFRVHNERSTDRSRVEMLLLRKVAEVANETAEEALFEEVESEWKISRSTLDRLLRALYDSGARKEFAKGTLDLMSLAAKKPT